MSGRLRFCRCGASNHFHTSRRLSLSRWRKQPWLHKPMTWFCRCGANNHFYISGRLRSVDTVYVFLRYLDCLRVRTRYKLDGKTKCWNIPNFNSQWRFEGYPWKTSVLFDRLYFVFPSFIRHFKLQHVNWKYVKCIWCVITIFTGARRIAVLMAINLFSDRSLTPFTNQFVGVIFLWVYPWQYNARDDSFAPSSCISKTLWFFSTLFCKVLFKQ